MGPDACWNRKLLNTKRGLLIQQQIFYSRASNFIKLKMSTGGQSISLILPRKFYLYLFYGYTTAYKNFPWQLFKQIILLSFSVKGLYSISNNFRQHSDCTQPNKYQKSALVHISRNIYSLLSKLEFWQSMIIKDELSERFAVFCLQVC